MTTETKSRKECPICGRRKDHPESGWCNNSDFHRSNVPAPQEETFRFFGERIAEAISTLKEPAVKVESVNPAVPLIWWVEESEYKNEPFKPMRDAWYAALDWLLSLTPAQLEQLRKERA